MAFFIHPEDTEVVVLHVDGALEEKQGPSPMSSYWFRKYYDKSPPVSEYFPQWPVQLTGNVGELPEPAGYQKGKAPGFIQPFVYEKFDFSNPAHHPFDETTLDLLIEELDKALESRLTFNTQNLKTKKLKESGHAALKRHQIELQAVHKGFSVIKESLAPYCEAFDYAGVVPHLHALDRLDCGDMTNKRDDKEGFSKTGTPKGRLSQYAKYYLRVLERHAKYAYVEAPE